MGELQVNEADKANIKKLMEEHVLEQQEMACKYGKEMLYAKQDIRDCEEEIWAAKNEVRKLTTALQNAADNMKKARNFSTRLKAAQALVAKKLQDHEHKKEFHDHLLVMYRKVLRASEKLEDALKSGWQRIEEAKVNKTLNEQEIIQNELTNFDNANSNMKLAFAAMSKVVVGAAVEATKMRLAEDGFSISDEPVSIMDKFRVKQAAAESDPFAMLG